MLSQLGRDLLAEMPWLDVDEESQRTILSNDDVFDALVCSLVARAVAIGWTATPSIEDAELAAVEGWIHLPLGRPAELSAG